MANILVIDDDDQIRAILIRGLAAAGHGVIGVENGQKGVKQAKRAMPDLVITDISMPDQEGMQTITELRALSADLPIIVISGEQNVGKYTPLDDAQALGADVAMGKPFELARLLGEVGRLLGEKGLR